MKSTESADVFKALADENRIDIVRYIARHPRTTASELLGRLDIAQSTLSHHMKVLADAGLVDVERSGKWTHYSINGVTVDKLDRFVNSLRSDRSLRARRARAAAMVALEEVERGPVEEVHN